MGFIDENIRPVVNDVIRHVDDMVAGKRPSQADQLKNAEQQVKQAARRMDKK